MQHLSEILSFFLIHILFVKGQFGPIFSYENGEYWGASRFDDTLGKILQMITRWIET